MSSAVLLAWILCGVVWITVYREQQRETIRLEKIISLQDEVIELNKKSVEILEDTVRIRGETIALKEKSMDLQDGILKTMRATISAQREVIDGRARNDEKKQERI